MIDVLADFIHMGGYALFIWPAWGLGLGVIVAITIISLKNSARVKARLANLDDGLSS